MVFNLTDELSDLIMSSMENQNERFLVDARSNSLIEVDSSVKPDGNLYYVLPEWTSAAGFELRKEFVDRLYSPVVRDELQIVLHSGRGVFRKFKDVLKLYPEFDRKWHLYKTHKMHIYITNWYNNLREEWGLEKLDQEPDETDDLVKNDFLFDLYNAEHDGEIIIDEIMKTASFFNTEWPEIVGSAVLSLWNYQFRYGDIHAAVGFVCRTLSGEFVGCITVVPCPEKSEQIVTVTSFFVLENFRGLGIGKELFSMCLSLLRDRHFMWVLIADIFIPNTMLPLLQRAGFKKIESGFIMNLSEKEILL